MIVDHIWHKYVLLVHLVLFKAEVDSGWHFFWPATPWKLAFFPNKKSRVAICSPKKFFSTYVLLFRQIPMGNKMFYYILFCPHFQFRLSVNVLMFWWRLLKVRHICSKCCRQHNVHASKCQLPPKILRNSTAAKVTEWLIVYLYAADVSVSWLGFLLHPSKSTDWVTNVCRIALPPALQQQKKKGSEFAFCAVNVSMHKYWNGTVHMWIPP